MIVRDKILEALGDIDNISDERLCDLLLDAFEAQRHEIKRLEGANAHERQSLHDSQEQLRQEMRRMRSDPLYCAAGDFYFVENGNFFHVHVRGSQIQMHRAGQNNVSFVAQQISPMEWSRK